MCCPPSIIPTLEKEVLQIQPDMQVATLSCRWYSQHRTTVRHLAVSFEGSRHVLTHIHYAGWPDRRCPPNLCTFSWLQAMMRSAQARTAIHCRAGIGRTGTFIAASLMCQHCTAFEACVYVRSRRPLCVHNREQYQFLEGYREQPFSRAASRLALQMGGYVAVIAVYRHWSRSVVPSWELHDSGYITVESVESTEVIQWLRTQLQAGCAIDRLRLRDWNTMYSYIKM